VKCIHCQHDAKYQERRDGRCPKCQHRFAFEPRTGDPLTDGVFAAALERVSSGGRVRFNIEHLYYEVRRRYLRRSPALAVAVGSAFAATVIAFTIGTGWSLLIWVLIMSASAGAYLWVRRRGTVPWRHLSRTTFDKLWRRYVLAHSAPSGLIERRARVGPASIDTREMLAYSFDRAVICDRPETVDLLIANQFHFENNCAVLSIDGYPPHAFQTVRTMLRNNPRLIVLALHDASLGGCQLAHRLSNDPDWFKDGVPVHDVGLRPRHAVAFVGQHERLRVPHAAAAGGGITSVEAHWLSGYLLALAVVIPEQIIKRLFRAITLAEDRQDSSAGGTDGGGSGGSGDGGLEFELDADSSDGGSDSFG
jgi:DNA-directed RNA polymerase subunit RPC12/RpoP